MLVLVVAIARRRTRDAPANPNPSLQMNNRICKGLNKRITTKATHRKWRDSFPVLTTSLTCIITTLTVYVTDGVTFRSPSISIWQLTL